MTIGGKARGLVRLKTIAPVPRFTVLENDWLAQAPASLSEVSRFVRAQELSPPFAVRSSAPEEDSDSLACAGIYESVMPVGWSGLEDAVRRVWDSGVSERVRVYRERAGLPQATASGVSVVIQELVDSRSSGVAFSMAPWDGHVLAIEAVAGFGSTLVDGEATPERHEFLREPLEPLRFTPGRQYLKKTASGTHRLAGRHVTAARLAPGTAATLAHLVLEVERQWPEAPNGVDVEWSIDESDKLFLLQCRPITTRSVRAIGAG